MAVCCVVVLGDKVAASLQYDTRYAEGDIQEDRIEREHARGRHSAVEISNNRLSIAELMFGPT